jgi:hypothetical protein
VVGKVEQAGCAVSRQRDACRHVAWNRDYEIRAAGLAFEKIFVNGNGLDFLHLIDGRDIGRCSKQL